MLSPRRSSRGSRVSIRTLTFSLALTLVLSLVVVLPAPQPASAAPRYTATAFDYDGYPVAINDAGQFVGTIQVPAEDDSPTMPHHGFLSSNGIVTDLGTLGGVNAVSEAYDINNLGQVVGFSRPDGGLDSAFLYSDGVMQNLVGMSRAIGINDVGQVVGQAMSWNGQWGNGDHAFLWQDGVMKDLGTLGGRDSKATAINNAGQVVGWSHTANGQIRAFLYSNGSMQDLGTLGRSESKAYAINNAGQIVGYTITATGQRYAFLYSNGVMQDLALVGAYDSVAFGINDAGQIVGNFGNYSVGSVGQHAFLWENGQMLDLNILPTTSSGMIEYIMWAFDINSHGQIAARSNYRGFVLNPVANSQPAITVNDATGPVGTTVSLTSTASDPDSDPLTYAWSLPAGTPCTIANATIEDTTVTCTQAGSYTATMTVSDGINASVSDTGTVTITPPTNQAPVVTIASVPAPVIAGQPLTLTNTVTDPDAGDSHTYAWSVIRNGQTLSTGTNATLTLTPASSGSYQVDLTVTDAAGATGATSTTITVVNPTPSLTSVTPGSVVAGAGETTITLTASNLVSGAVVSWNGTTLATTVTSTTELTALVPASFLAAPGVGYVTIANPGTSASNMLAVLITDASTSVTSMSTDTSTSPDETASATTSSTGGNDPRVSVTATGIGTVLVAEYQSNPSTSPATTSFGTSAGQGITTSYFDVNVAPDSQFSQLTIVFCDPAGGKVASWYNSATSTWTTVSNQTYDAATKCITMILDETTSPKISELTGTYFAAGYLRPYTVVGGGLQQPINADGSSVFKAGTTIPVKVKLQAVDGSYPSTLAPTITIKLKSATTPGQTINEPVTTTTADASGVLRFDATSQQYVYQLGTKSLSDRDATYTITITVPATGQTIVTDVKLRSK